MNVNPGIEIEMRALDGVTSVVELYEPSANPQPLTPVLLCLPAMGVQASYYRPFAARLRALTGCPTALADLRGQGTSSAKARRGATFGYREIVELDLPAIFDALEARHPHRPVCIVGHSLGGQLGSVFAGRYANRLGGLVLVASGTAHYRRWPARDRRRAFLTVHGIRLAAAVLPYYPGTVLGFGGDQPRRLMRDWGLNGTSGRYQLESSNFDYESAMNRVRLPVLAIEIAEDPVAPPGAVDELLGKLRAATIVRQPARGIASDKPWRRHFSWARQPDEIADVIGDWLTSAFGQRRQTAEPRVAVARRAATVPAVSI